MSIQINTWLRAYFALQSTAMESRGFIEVNPGEDDAARWPRTIGADVMYADTNDRISDDSDP